MELASENISGFSTELKYYTVCESEKITTNSDTNKVYTKDDSVKEFSQNIVFSPNATMLQLPVVRIFVSVTCDDGIGLEIMLVTLDTVDGSADKKRVVRT